MQENILLRTTLEQVVNVIQVNKCILLIWTVYYRMIEGDKTGFGGGMRSPFVASLSAREIWKKNQISLFSLCENTSYHSKNYEGNVFEISLDYGRQVLWGFFPLFCCSGHGRKMKYFLPTEELM